MSFGCKIWVDREFLFMYWPSICEGHLTYTTCFHDVYLQNLKLMNEKGDAGDGPREMITPLLRASLEKQGYKLIGTHSGVKLCRWTKVSLLPIHWHSWRGFQVENKEIFKLRIRSWPSIRVYKFNSSLHFRMRFKYFFHCNSKLFFKIHIALKLLSDENAEN